ncbi:MAG TPA: J domain-containing protein [Dehalococcoidia bacterium]|nr:J domain-containing protein [Dehalococcoidia bacterium]
MEERDYYEVLQLHPSADHAMIVQAYWYLARKYKAGMDRDASAEQALQELNRSFDVLGDSESRAAYDEARTGKRAADETLDPDTKRVSIEVCFWNLPAWQGMLAATGAVALAILALASGAQPLPTLGLTAMVVLAALLALPEHIPFVQGRIPGTKRWRRELRAADLERSTSQIITRWRQTNPQVDGTTIVEFSKGTTYPPRS